MRAICFAFLGRARDRTLKFKDSTVVQYSLYRSGRQYWDPGVRHATHRDILRSVRVCSASVLGYFLMQCDEVVGYLHWVAAALRFGMFCAGSVIRLRVSGPWTFGPALPAGPLALDVANLSSIRHVAGVWASLPTLVIFRRLNISPMAPPSCMGLELPGLCSSA